jgi:hypothetical protein
LSPCPKTRSEGVGERNGTISLEVIHPIAILGPQMFEIFSKTSTFLLFLVSRLSTTKTSFLNPHTIIVLVAETIITSKN